MPILALTGSVGTGKAKVSAPHNAPADVILVRDRLINLGFTWVGGAAKGDEKEFIRTIKLFQSICAGSGQLIGDGRIDLKKNIHEWLESENAPIWVKIFNQDGPGWKCTSDFKESNGGYCSSWLYNRLWWAGIIYRGLCFFYQIADAPPMWVRECSPTKGGDAVGHASHETGIDMDMRLPLLPPDTDKWDDLGSNGYKNKRFHKNAAIMQLTAIKLAMDTQLVLFNDPDLIKRGLCSKYKNHDQHYHLRIKPASKT